MMLVACLATSALYARGDRDLSNAFHLLTKWQCLHAAKESKAGVFDTNLLIRGQVKSYFTIGGFLVTISVGILLNPKRVGFQP
jgi:hypothetical protein